VGQYVRQLGAEGLPPDAAFLTALMMVHARAGRYSLALQVFDELRSSPHAATDVPSWSAVTAVHAMQGNMQEAEAAAQQAANLASSQGRPPPVTAFGALVRAYVRQSNLPPALAALKQFMVLGGRPSTRLLDPVVLLCLRKGDRQAAAKVIRAAVGADYQLALYVLHSSAGCNSRCSRQVAR
jgi:pentatricopeptide repeat protein